MAVNPVTGELLTEHSLSESSASNTARYVLIESFSSYLEKLMER